MNNYSDKIAITTGDPNGIGAEIKQLSEEEVLTLVKGNASGRVER